MGRSSTFGMRHLVKRPEGGFSYIRDLSVSMAETLSGELSLSWVADRRKVGGRKVLKVALGTGDLALARDRWLEVHSQVEHLVGFAKDNFQRRKPRPAVPSRVQSLSGEAIRDIADSVYRQILAADDDEALSGHHADLTELVLNEMAEMAVGEEPNAYQAKREAHLREYDHLRAHSRHVEHYDFDAEKRLPTVESLIGEGVAPANARSIREDLAGVIGENAVEAAMAESGVDLPRGHPDRKKLAIEVIRAGMRGHKAVLERLDGGAVATPPVKASLLFAEPDEGLKLAAAYTTWKQEQNPSARTAEGYRLYVDRFVEINGDISITAITKKHVKAYRDALTGCPRNVPRDKSGLSFWRLHAWAAAEGQPVLSRTTINDKAIGAISAILTVAVRNGDIDSNPCTGMKFVLKDGEVAEREPYDDDDLVAMLASPIFAQGKRYEAGGGEAQKWLPLISLFCGARLEEIGQLRVIDIKRDGDIDYFDMREIDDTPGQETSRKTRSSRRRIPIHASLITMGLLAHVDQQKQGRSVRLFPDLKEYDGKTTHYFSKFWGRYARNFVTKSPRKTFHSFRHRVTDELRKGGRYPVMQALLGHHLGDTTSIYGAGFDLETLNCLMQQLDYSSFDTSKIK